MTNSLSFGLEFDFNNSEISESNFSYVCLNEGHKL